jgi:ribosomal protein S18 acetylase RimI-like enzyme
MHILKAEKTDLKSILELQLLAYQSEAQLLNNYEIPPLLETLEEVEQEYHCGIILKMTTESGLIIGSVRGYTKENTLHIGKLIVHPDYQGQGFGTQLLLDMEKICPQKRFELFTSNKSLRNIKLYERLGYKTFKEQIVSQGLKFIYLEKYL